MTEQFWIQLLDRFGVPVAVLAFLAIGLAAVWRYLSKDGGWFEVLKDGVKGTFSLVREFIESVRVQGERHTGALSEARDILAVHDKNCRDNTCMIRQIHAGAVEACDSLEVMIDRGSYPPVEVKEALGRVRAALERRE